MSTSTSNNPSVSPASTFVDADRSGRAASVDRQARARRAGSIPATCWIGLAVVGILAFVAGLQTTRHGAGLAPDSAVYLGTARNLIDGRGLTTPFNLMFNPYPPARVAAFHGNIPLTQYPPFFPLVLAFFGSLGAGLIDTARILNSVLLGINAVLAGILVMRITRSTIVAVTTAAGFAISVNVLLTHSLVMSEPLMLSVLLVGILLLPRLLRAPSPSSLVAVGVCAAAVSLTRLAGVSFTATAAVAVLLWVPRPRAVRVRLAGLLVAMGIGPLALWAIVTRAVSPSAGVRPVRFHPPGWRQFDTAVDTASDWLVGTGPDRPARVAVLAVLLLVVVILGVVLALRRPSRGGSDAADRDQDVDAHRLLGILAIFVVAYLGMVLVTNVFLDASTSLEGRLLLPVQFTFGILVVGLVYEASRLHLGRTIAVVAAVAVVIFCAWPARSVTRAFGSTSAIGALRDGAYAARKHSRLAAAAARLPTDTLLATNVPAKLYVDSGRASIFIPPRILLVAGERNPAFRAQIAELGRVLAGHHGYVVLYDDHSSSLPSIGDLRRAMRLTEVARSDGEGTIYRVDSARS